jgi:predicted DNA binding CopG/RHH family protein
MRPLRFSSSGIGSLRIAETHDSTDHVDWSRAEKVRLSNLKPPSTSISLRLPNASLERINVAAGKHDVPYQSLIKIWLVEKVEPEGAKQSRRGMKRRSVAAFVRHCHRQGHHGRRLATRACMSVTPTDAAPPRAAASWSRNDFRRSTCSASILGQLRYFLSHRPLSSVLPSQLIDDLVEYLTAPSKSQSHLEATKVQSSMLDPGPVNGLVRNRQHECEARLLSTTIGVSRLSIALCTILDYPSGLLLHSHSIIQSDRNALNSWC